MRIILSLLVPFLLSFTCVVQADTLYSVSWYSADCDENEAGFSLDAISREVDKMLSGKTWNKKVKQLQMRDFIVFENSACCFEMYNCDECRRCELLETDRFLQGGPSKAALITACKAALDAEANKGMYSGNCQAAMIAATCEVLITVYHLLTFLPCPKRVYW
jgi:hypothetical protein